MPSLPQQIPQTQHSVGDDVQAHGNWIRDFEGNLRRVWTQLAYTVNALCKVDTQANRPTTPALNEILFVSSNDDAEQLSAAVDGAWVAPYTAPLLRAYTEAALPAAGTAGRLARVTNNERGVWMDQGAQWFSLSNEVVDVREFGAVGNGTTDDTAAIQAAIDALGTTAQGTAGFPNVNSATGIVGGTVFLPRGRYRTTATLTMRPWVNFVGAGRWGSGISLDTASAVPVITMTNAGWSRLADLYLETTAVAVSGQDGVRILSTVSFGGKAYIERVNAQRCYNQISVGGSVTHGLFRDLYLRNAANHSFFADAGMSATRLDNIYCSNPANGGMIITGGIGSSHFSNIITETTGGDGLRLDASSRNSLNAMYIGDQVGDQDDGSLVANGIHLVQSSDNVFNGVFLNMDSNARGSAVLLDSSGNNTFNGVRATGSSYRYTIEWSAAAGGNTDPLLPNTFRGIRTTSASTLGFRNNHQYIVVEGASPDQSDVATIAGTQASNLSHFWRHEQKQDGLLIRTDDAPASTANIPYPVLQAQDRWSFLRSFPGADNYSMMSCAGGTLGVLPASETLVASLLTGDDADFDPTVGNWTAPGVDTFTSVTGGVTGNAGQWLILGTGALTTAVRQQSHSVESGKLYKLTFDAKVTVAASTLRVWVGVWNDADTDYLNRSEYILNQNDWQTYTVYFLADGTNARIRMTRNTASVDDAILFDNFSLREVQSASSLKISGGRKFGQATFGGGGSIELFGVDHANVSQVQVTGNFVVGASGKATTNLQWNATASVADGGTVTHGLGGTPTAVLVTPTTSGEMVSVTAVSSTTFTVAIKTHAGAAGTTQTLYWIALR